MPGRAEGRGGFPHHGVWVEGAADWHRLGVGEGEGELLLARSCSGDVRGTWGMGMGQGGERGKGTADGWP